jgi:alcohol dehydrogenase class IV
MTGGHRLPAGVTGDRRVRPSLVVNDPDVSASQPGPALAASAMNALGHAFEALYAPRANPLAELAALRAAALIAAGVGAGDPDRPAVGLGALLAGWAMDTTGFAVHHVLCQSVVRRSGASHAGVNAVLLPHVVRLMAPRAPREVALFAEALGAGSEPGAEVARLAGRAGATRLEELGVDGAALDGALADALRRPELADTPDAPGEDELRSLLEAAR